MKLVHLAGAIALAFCVAGCATSSTKPVAVQTLSADQIATLHLKQVTATASPGVTMTQSDFDRIGMKIRNELSAATPGILVDPTSADAATAGTLKVNFTQYDSGSAFARAMLIGLGQIHVEGDVTIADSTGATAGQYKVAKQFALGGIAGATTSIEDVEDGFAKSVAEIVKKK
jgi:hypothetical protein